MDDTTFVSHRDRENEHNIDPLSFEYPPNTPAHDPKQSMNFYHTLSTVNNEKLESLRKLMLDSSLDTGSNNEIMTAT